MRPAFGSGEDWNPEEDLLRLLAAALRPAFGSGEDWNAHGLGAPPKTVKLRPAFGSGEDWNSVVRARASRVSRCARPSGRARIGTSRR